MKKPVVGTGSAAGEMWIAVEGPLRAGKSSLCRLLAERTAATVIAEPDANPFLERFYRGERGMAFAAQMWFLRKRIEQLQAASRARGWLISDYMLEKDKIYAHLNLSDAELAIYREYYATHAPKRKPDLVVYVQAKPAVLAERRRRKGAPSERGLADAYTNQVAEAYEHFFGRYHGSRLLVVDTSAIDFVANARERELLLERILAPVHGREHFAPLARTA